MQRTFCLGLWNPAGAKTTEFKTKEEREAARKAATDAGYICWEVGDVNTR
ncbi:hypothetical protein SynSYN20_01561 [Synechococcus sp. SYN20]|nr:hypothetical protein [Synechococcus sp. SYN20]QNJ25888.1 hypothetical protein SynSYN20_01561 [Synechococcus sp. SYN20]